MQCVVWMDSWEMQCCGSPFEVGSQVEWTVRPASEEFITSLSEPLGSEIAKQVTHTESHHGEGESVERVPLAAIQGIVKSINAVYWRFARLHPDNPFSIDVPGSGWLEARTAANGWESENGDHVSFTGYLIGLDLP